MSLLGITEMMVKEVTKDKIMELARKKLRILCLCANLNIRLNNSIDETNNHIIGGLIKK